MAWISHPIIRTFDKICLSFLLHPNSTHDKDTLLCRQEDSIHKNRLHLALKFVLKIQSTQSKCWYGFVKIKRQHVGIWTYGNIGWTFVTRMRIGCVCNNPPILPLFYSAWSVTREIYSIPEGADTTGIFRLDTNCTGMNIQESTASFPWAAGTNWACRIASRADAS